MFRLQTSKIIESIAHIELLISSSGNFDVWKITNSSRAKGSKLDLKRFKAELHEEIGYLQYYDIFHNDKIKNTFYLYFISTRDRTPTRR